MCNTPESFNCETFNYKEWLDKLLPWWAVDAIARVDPNKYLTEVVVFLNVKTCKKSSPEMDWDSTKMCVE